jgi:hypothetical protein
MLVLLLANVYTGQEEKKKLYYFYKILPLLASML